MTPFGTTLLLWRVERHLSQDALAKRAGLSRPNLSAIERGKREVSLKTLRALALALEVRPGVLVDGIAPGRSVTRRWSRKRLEQLADAVIGRAPGQDAEARRLTRLFQTLLQTRLSTLKGPRPPRRAGKRSVTRAWLQLSASYAPAMIHSVIQRINDRARLLQRTA